MKADFINKNERKEFQRIFGVNFSLYWDNLLGFDIVKFDNEVVQADENESMSEAIQKKWGQEGHDMILKLLQFVPLTSN